MFYIMLFYDDFILCGIYRIYVVFIGLAVPVPVGKESPHRGRCCQCLDHLV